MTGILSVFTLVADALDAQGSVSGCPLGNIAPELSRSDEELRALIGSEYRKWREAIVAKLRMEERIMTDTEGFAVMVVALFRGAMSLAKVEQNGQPLRHCAARLQAMAR